MEQKVKGISLITLVITITGRYDKGNKHSKIASFLQSKYKEIVENIKYRSGIVKYSA